MSAHEASNESTCKCCRHYFGLDIPVLEEKPINIVRDEARTHSIDIFKTWINLHRIIRRFEDVIQKRWRKKNTKQRVAILLGAWPAMATTHRPDFAGMREGCKKHRKVGEKTKTREAHLWPFINTEDLAQLDTLLIYMHARGRYMPSRFVYTDARYACFEKPGVPNDCPTIYGMQLYLQKTPTSYGSIQEIAEDYGAYKATRAGSGYVKQMNFHPLIGLLVLEVQSRILRFLETCARLVLHDVDLDRPPLLYPLSISTLPPTATYDHDISTLAADAPYRLPARLNVDRLMNIVSARRDSAEDHIWALREDPGYMAVHMQEAAEHAPCKNLNSKRKPCACVDTDRFWQICTQRMLAHAYGALIIWTRMQTVLAQLVDINNSSGRCKMQHEESINASFHMCTVTRDLFRELDIVLILASKWALSNFECGVYASPALREYFLRDTDHCPILGWNDMKTSRKAGSQLHFLLRCLSDPEQHRMYGLPNIVDEIQRSLRTPANRYLISSWVSDSFADLALFVEMGRQLEMYQPWCMTWREGTMNEYALHPITEDILSERYELEDTLQYAIKFEKLRPAMFSYPVEKRSTMSTNKQMRESERHLDDLFVRIDLCFLESMDKMLHDYVFMYLDEPDRDLARTPEWRESTGTPRSTGRAIRSVQGHLTTTAALGDVDPNARIARPSKASLMVVTPSKEKQKTKGTACLTMPPVESSFVEATEEAKPSISTGTVVSKRVYKVLAAFFHVPGDPYNPGEVPWAEFLHAMTALGFSAEKLFGSSWQFNPPAVSIIPTSSPCKTGQDCANAVGGDAETSAEKEVYRKPFQCHEPHPDPKLRYWEVKRIARRLNRTYGWHGGMFACK